MNTAKKIIYHVSTDGKFFLFLFTCKKKIIQIYMQTTKNNVGKWFNGLLERLNFDSNVTETVQCKKCQQMNNREKN